MTTIVTGNDKDLKPWAVGASWHGGSSFGTTSQEMRLDVAKAAYLVARDTDIRRGNYGGGKPNGYMTVGPVAFAKAGVRNNIGVNLKFLMSLQGGEKALGLRNAIASDIHERMLWMRHGTDNFVPNGLDHSMDGTEIELAAPGGKGTFQEILEWIVAPNSIRKPVAALNFGGYYEGLDEAFNGLVRNGLAPESLLVDRWKLINTPSDVVEYVNDLNSRPPVVDGRENLNPQQTFVEETDRAVIVEPLSLKGIYDLACDLVDADLSPSVAQPGHTIKPRILIRNGNGVTEGLQAEFNKGFDETLIHPGRRQLLHYVDSLTEARALARTLSLVTPEQLGLKHGEKPKGNEVEGIVNKAIAQLDLAA